MLSVVCKSIASLFRDVPVLHEEFVGGGEVHPDEITSRRILVASTKGV